MVKSNQNNRGQILVLVVIALVVLIGFAALAIDVGYFYHAKNQLQGSADAAALAGVAKLNYGKTDTVQLDARQEAWMFACKNRAAGQNVYLVKSGTNCDSPPASGLNETTNSSNGDIVLGTWIEASGIFTTSSSYKTNAVQVTSRLSGTQPNKSVGTFFGKIFGVSNVAIKATATAMVSSSSLKKPTIVVCDNVCGMATPLTTGTDFHIDNKSTPYGSWTSWLGGNGASAVDDYWNGVGDTNSNLPAQTYCGKTIILPSGIKTSVIKSADPVIINSSATYTVNGQTVFGDMVLIPVMTGCTDPNNSSGTITKLTTGIMTQSVHSGSQKYVTIVATGYSATPGFSVFTCYTCGTTPGVEALDRAALLVK